MSCDGDGQLRRLCCRKLPAEILILGQRFGKPTGNVGFKTGVLQQLVEPRDVAVHRRRRLTFFAPPIMITVNRRAGADARSCTARPGVYDFGS